MRRPEEKRRAHRETRWDPTEHRTGTGIKIKKRSRPISRVLSWTVIHLGCVSPRTSSDLPGNSAGHANVPLFGLAPSGVFRAVVCYHRRGALLPHLFTLTGALRRLGGMFSVALSVGSHPPGVTWHPALRSPDFPLRQCAATVWPTPARNDTRLCSRLERAGKNKFHSAARSASNWW